jgi:hypothetical protein
VEVARAAKAGVANEVSAAKLVREEKVRVAVRIRRRLFCRLCDSCASNESRGKLVSNFPIGALGILESMGASTHVYVYVEGGDVEQVDASHEADLTAHDRRDQPDERCNPMNDEGGNLVNARPSEGIRGHQTHQIMRGFDEPCEEPVRRGGGFLRRLGPVAFETRRGALW